jgi:predicted porin
MKMKRSIIALAAIAAAWQANAQSSVTLFGVVDTVVAHGRGSLTKRTQLTHSGQNSSRIGFRGVEDLGGGMAASFWLEAHVVTDNGTGQATNTNNQASGGALAGLSGGQGLTFNRRSTVSLSGGWGELRLGRDYASTFWNIAADPFGFNGVGQTIVAAAAIGAPTVQVRVSNAVAYFLPPNLGGFYGQAQYYMGENASGTPTEDDGTGGNLRLGWTNGKLNVALGAARTSYASGDLRAINAMAQYDFGWARLITNWQREELDSPIPATGRGGLIGVRIPLGPQEVKFSYSTYRRETGAAEPRSTKLAAGYVYNLSKRTSVYASYARVSNRGGAAIAVNGATTAANASSSGVDLGISHAF